MKIADIARVIEAVLFVSGDGVDRDEFKRIYDLSDKELNKCLDILKEKYKDDSGIHLISYKNKLQLCSNPALADSVAEILNPIRERSLTKAALETIAIVAYKQPITRTEIEQIRGVNSDYAVQLLQSNNLIEVVGRKDAVGKPLLFGTTDNFLKRFELTSLEELPNYRELLDRIRVIHSEGDSLYREFTIPDEESAENEDVSGEQGEISTSEVDKKNEDTTSEPLELKVKTVEIETGVLGETENVETAGVKNPRKKAKEVKKDLETEHAEQSVEVSEEIQNVLSEDVINNVKEKSVETLELDNNIVTETKEVKPRKRKNIIEQIASIEEPIKESEPAVEESVEEKPKLSWRDKMRAKMDENSEHYGNLQEYIKK